MVVELASMETIGTFMRRAQCLVKPFLLLFRTHYQLLYVGWGRWGSVQLEVRMGAL